MKKIGLWHLYLSCFFAPWLIFFTLSGALQTLDLHRGKKTGSEDRPWVRPLSRFTEIHIRQRLGWNAGPPSRLFRAFVVAMSAGFLASTVLGIILAFRRSPRWGPILAALLLGWGLPWLVLLWPGLAGGP